MKANGKGRETEPCSFFLIYLLTVSDLFNKEIVELMFSVPALYPLSPDPVLVDSVLIDKPYFRFIVGGDYNFSDGSYFNIQYLHGFMHERGSSQLNDYFFVRYEKRFFNEKLLVAPLGGAFIISDRKKIKNNSTLVYVPQITYKATDDIELSFSAAVFNGKGDNMFSKFNDYDMFMFSMKCSF